MLSCKCNFSLNLNILSKTNIINFIPFNRIKQDIKFRRNHPREEEKYIDNVQSKNNKNQKLKNLTTYESDYGRDYQSNLIYKSKKPEYTILNIIMCFIEV